MIWLMVLGGVAAVGGIIWWASKKAEENPSSSSSDDDSTIMDSDTEFCDTPLSQSLSADQLRRAADRYENSGDSQGAEAARAAAEKSAIDREAAMINSRAAANQSYSDNS